MSGVEVVGIILAVIPILVEGLQTLQARHQIYSLSLPKTTRSGKAVPRPPTPGDTIARAFEKHPVAERVRSRSIGLVCGVLRATTTRSLSGSIWACTTKLSWTPSTTASMSCRSSSKSLQNLCPRQKVHPSPSSSFSTANWFQCPPALSKIYDENKSAKGRRPDLTARLLLMVNKKDFSLECDELDASSDFLERTLSLISSNHQLAKELPTRKAKRLAKAYGRSESMQTTCTRIYRKVGSQVVITIIKQGSSWRIG